MSSELSLFQDAGLPADLDKIQEAFGRVADKQEGGGLDGKQLLKMTKQTGHWIFGQAKDEVGEGEHIIIHPASFKQGYVDWGDGEILGEHTVSIFEPLPQIAQLEPAQGERGWSEQLSFDAQFFQIEELAEVRLIYKTNALGGRESVRKLAGEIMAQLKKDPAHPVPVISLSNTSYDHKKYGKIFKPEFQIVQFVDLNGNEAVEGAPEVGAGDEEKPRRRRRRGA